MVDIWEGSEVTEEGEMAPSRTADLGHRAGIYCKELVLAKWSQIHLNVDFTAIQKPQPHKFELWSEKKKKSKHPYSKSMAVVSIN